LRSRLRRALRRTAQAGLGLALLLALALTGFRISAALRETERRRPSPERPGAFVATPEGELRYLERGGAQGRPVVFIGGTMATSDTFVPLMDALCDERLRCVALDLPPFGYSERPPDGGYGRQRQAARIVALVRALGLRDVVLVGHSFGAGPTVETAMRYPDDVRTFALMAGALGLDAGPPSRAVRALFAVPPLRTALSSATFANPWAVRASLRSFIENDALVTDEVAQRFTNPARVQGTAAAVGEWARSAFFSDESASRSGQRASYRRYERPVLLVWGDKDTATPVGQAEVLKALLPRSRLDVIPSVGHFPHVEAQPRVVEVLRPFLLFVGGQGAARSAHGLGHRLVHSAPGRLPGMRGGQDVQLQDRGHERLLASFIEADDGVLPARCSRHAGPEDRMTDALADAERRRRKGRGRGRHGPRLERCARRVARRRRLLRGRRRERAVPRRRRVGLAISRQVRVVDSDQVRDHVLTGARRPKELLVADVGAVLQPHAAVPEGGQGDAHAELGGRLGHVHAVAELAVLFEVLEAEILDAGSTAAG
jgi:pimeloyl-ACP methyl ester carboxylesterase